MQESKLVQTRCQIYGILSRCFCYPNQDFLGYVKGDLVKDLESSLRKLPYGKDIKKSYKLFKSVLPQQSARFSLEDWQVEYTETFIYARDSLSCLPYESIYRENGKCLQPLNQNDTFQLIWLSL